MAYKYNNIECDTLQELLALIEYFEQNKLPKNKKPPSPIDLIPIIPRPIFPAPLRPTCNSGEIWEKPKIDNLTIKTYDKYYDDPRLI